MFRYVRPLALMLSGRGSNFPNFAFTVKPLFKLLLTLFREVTGLIPVELINSIKRIQTIGELIIKRIYR